LQNKTKYHILFTSAWYPSRVEQYNGNFVKRHALAVSTMQKVTVLYIQSDENCKKVETFITQINENFKEIIVYFPRNKIHFLNPIIKLFLFQKYVKWVGKFDLIHHNVLFLETIWVYFRKLFYKMKSKYLKSCDTFINIIKQQLKRINYFFRNHP